MQKIVPNLTSLAKYQILLLALSAIVAGIFWAVGQEVNPLIILVYALALGNLSVLATAWIDHFYTYRRFPYNWPTSSAGLNLRTTPPCW
jgi:hypothetical protein